MCERYSLTTDLSEVQHYFQIDQVTFHYKYRDNIMPTEQIPVVIAKNGTRMLEEYRWGLMPFWAKDAVNVSREHVREKPAFYRLFARNRCVVPCNGYYEEQSDDNPKHRNKPKQRLRIAQQYGGVFGLAGIYDVRVNSFGEEIRTCTIITTDSAEPQSPAIPDWSQRRKPVVLQESSFDDWLNPRVSDRELLSSLLWRTASENYVTTVHRDLVKP